eukprot:PhF_6_TR14197/c0_g1_i1/m.22741/K11662/ACTR6, ARP6; actin-related protein 6
MIVVDNGSDVLKFCEHGNHECTEIPNVVGRTSKGKSISFVGRNIHGLLNTTYSGLVLCRPSDMGFLCDVQLQRLLWSGYEWKGIKDIVLTVPPLTPEPLRGAYETLVLQSGHGASRVRFVTPQYLAALSHAKSVCLVVDVGFSCTWIVPYLNREPLWDSARRVDVGGKVLTNALKEVLSFRQFDLRADTCLVNHIKHFVCYVSENPKQEMEVARKWNTTTPEERERHRNTSQHQYSPMKYVLPQGGVKGLGHVHNGTTPVSNDTQMLSITHERFSIPEALFSPLTLGIDQGGVAEAIHDSIKGLDPWIQEALLDNIILTGGCGELPGIQQRITVELERMVEQGTKVSVVYKPMRDIVRDCAQLGSKGFEHWVTLSELDADRTTASGKLWANVK